MKYALDPKWFFDLHGTVSEMVTNDANVPLLATRHLRSLSTNAAIEPEFELLRDGNAFVEFDFAFMTSDDLWLGEAKKRNVIAQSAKATRREITKLIEGVRSLKASGLILATSEPAWSGMTMAEVKDDIGRRESAGEVVPRILLLTGLGTGAEHLLSLSGEPVRRI